ncbi:N-acyl-D-amino-acid deacylase family protein [Actinophytocola algeriensis]|uniref:N-acyl-D-amino-acid deacylase n=1 Tax=Actinophytocola algeriensis TaxID=1768010 RepID=A0A7W7QAG3_9PSEU|nr:amidohydrolase family protein [Actinophytocola algeriensis]MBB4909970.1 N-acyl-D-amino-acid deacylase [Actinophytocola algeriensis]MBE1475960.1 N-acyl-D-amino-acid deacylase [Actinophytocola algeriensis]
MTSSDLLLAGGTLVDGTGAAPRAADVLVRGEWIAGVLAPGATVSGARTIDVSGRVVCPGFVDIHTHSDLALLSNPKAHSKVRQGVTTEVVGNCGLGVAPVGTDVAGLRSAVAYLDLDPAVEIAWRTVGEYLDAVAGTSVHVATLAGHIPLRAAVMGLADRPATTAEIDDMCALLTNALADGALGLSTGLVYPPLRAARTAELRALAEVVADHDAVFAWHLRDYGDDLVPSATEAVRIAQLTGARTQISHLAAVGKRNWGRVRDVLAMAGPLIGFDAYPYLAGNAPLSQLLPDQVTVDDLADPVVRERVEVAWRGNPVPWTEITVAGGATDAVLGRTIASLAGESRSASAVAMDLIAAYGHAVIMTAGGRSETDLRTVLGHPATVVASDGLALDPDGPTGHGFPHPRSFGTFPRAVAKFGANLAAIVHKCTRQPAEQVGLTDRGVVAPGRRADLVVLDMERLADRATFTRPHRFPGGVDLVLVAGTTVVTGEEHTGATPGTVVRRAER